MQRKDMSPSTMVYSILVMEFLISTAYAESITKILDSYPDFIDLNKLLVSTGIDKQIDRQPAVTILALDNDEIEQLSRVKEPREMANIIRAHVVLDYYDDIKLRHLRFFQVQEMATLYQSGGSAQDKQGLLKVTRKEDGVFFQSSGRKPSPGDAKFIDRIYIKKDTISVMEIDHPVYIDGLTAELEPSPPPSPPTGAKAPMARAPVGNPKRSPAPSPLYAKSPVSDAASGLAADAKPPGSDAAYSPWNVDDDDDEDDEFVDDESSKEKKKSSAGKVTFGLATLIMAAACIAATL